MNWWSIDDNKIAKNFAQTYTDIGARDGWDRVQEYRRVAEYMAEHPNKGSCAVASALELPRSRLRSWVDDDSRPDPVRGLEVAADKGWLTRDWDDSTARALNVLVAWIFSGGSIIVKNKSAYFTVDSERAEDVVKMVLATAGVGVTLTRQTESARATEIIPDEHQTVLGRILSAWGAPVGTKNRDTDLSVPAYLKNAPDTIVREFARTYVANRGLVRTDRSDQLQISEERNAAYRNQLQHLFERAFPESTRITSSDVIIYIYADNTSEIASYPTWSWLSNV